MMPEDSQTTAPTSGLRQVTLLTASLLALATGFVIIMAAGLPARATFTGQLIEGERVAPEVGALAPPFTHNTLAGDPFSLRDLRGSPVVLNFWATWCEPCRVEMPILQSLQDNNPGLRVVGVNLGEPAALVQAWVDDFALDFTIVLDPDGGLSRLYYLLGQPTTYIIAPDGRITHVFYGPVPEAHLRSALAPHLE